MASRPVEISRTALALLVGALTFSLVLVAFLLGRESARPVAASTPSVRTSAPPVLYAAGSGSEQATETESLQRSSPGLPTRYLSDSQGETASAQVQPSTSREAAQASEGARRAETSSRVQSLTPQQKEETREYLAEIDLSLAATPSLSDPNSFATQLLGQSMTGDTSGFDILLTEANGALSRMQAIEPPAHCQEHHALSVKQLKFGITLLGKVKDATQGMDTAALAQLSVQGHALQAEIGRLQRLDQELRASLR